MESPRCVFPENPYARIGRTYRGRIISLEAHHHPMGGGSSVKVHRLAKVKREDVILPQKTLATLDRNVAGFMASREALKSMQFQARKGLLFYGPPGTGKTHTIYYLASQLPNHTTLLITAEQVGLLGEYFRLARYLQPSVSLAPIRRRTRSMSNMPIYG